MLNKNFNHKVKLSIVKLIFFSILILFLFVTFINHKTFSNVVPDDEYENFIIWDGKSIASKFASGDGTMDNPYEISSGEEFIYFKSLIESDEEEYKKAYYILTEDINLNNNKITSIGNKSNYFQGNLNGDGHTIAFINIDSISDENNKYSGLFSYAKNATIENIILEEVKIETEEDTITGILIADSENNNINNIGIYNSKINSSGLVGGVFGKSTNDSLSSSYINVEFKNEENSLFSSISNNTKLNTVIFFSNENNTLFKNGDIELNDTYKYSYNNDKFSFIKFFYDKELSSMEEDIDLDYLADMLTSSIEEKYTWEKENEYLRFYNIYNITSDISPMTFSMPLNGSIPINETGIDENTVYINDLESDWNYYMGLNYTSNDGYLPDTTNKNIYSNKNLVPVYIKYSSIDFQDESKVGYVSLTERQTEYIYYKYYPVIDGYVNIELIDNPFTDRPTDMGFNGWVTNYSNAVISYDKNYYTRYVKIPVSYSDDIPNTIEINMNANWIKASVYEMNTDTNDWSNAFDSLNNAGMSVVYGKEKIYEDTTNYYYKDKIGRFSRYPTGALSSTGSSLNGYCWSSSCEYYTKITTNDYDPSQTYYKLENKKMVEYQIQVIGYNTIGSMPDEYKVAGLFKELTLPNGSDATGYYDQKGDYLENIKCSSSSGCTYYELIQYYDKDGNISQKNPDETYYMLVTRDTNIIVMERSQSSAWTKNHSKPFTLTSVYNGVDYRSSVTWSVNNIVVNCYADTTIENIKINSNQSKTTTDTTPSSTTTTSRYFFGRWNNVKLGRGITQNNQNTNFNFVIGGTSESVGSSTNIKKYRLTIESGLYNAVSLSSGAVGTSYTSYLEAKALYGSDYDRASNNNSLLNVVFCTSGSYGGIYNASTSTNIIFDTTVKSGSFGTNKYDYTTGIYVGGRNGGTHNAARRITFEGGYSYNIIGGPLTNSNRSSYNDSYIYIKGGSIDTIIGGAGTSATYGNRIIQITGGTINYSVFGGSNGYQGTSDDGTVNGSSFIYVGGNSIIGSDANILENNTLWGAEAGSVFGIGNGRSGSSYVSVGSSDNSNIIISDSAIINRNIYGGGNYGATGISGNSSNTYSKIIMQGGTVKGSIYGGGNNNGSGSAPKTSTININMLDGKVEGSIYGGSRQNGTIYGNVNIDIIGGKIDESIYGGGEGGYTSTSSQGTYVSGNVNINIGNRTYNKDLLVQKNVYGGSAFGVVNGTSIASNKEDKNVLITVNSGIIRGSVFGGGQGNSSNTAYVSGNVNLNINGGKINNVYGGSDISGEINGDITLNLFGGVISNVYGGGNKADIVSSKINLNGSVVKDLYGGGNSAGADQTNVKLINGLATNVYGGSNQSGDVKKSNITTSINEDFKEADIKLNIEVDARSPYDWEQTTYLSFETLKISVENNLSIPITKWKAKIKTVDSTLNYNYSSTDIKLVDSTYEFDETNKYYGKNILPANSKYTFEFGISSNVSKEDFKIVATELIGYDDEGNEYVSSSNTLKVNNIYGGNNNGGTTTDVDINVDSIKVNNIYGGGNKADVLGNTKLYINDSNIFENVYGGGNSANILGDTFVLIAGQTTVNKSVFGGGNSGAVGNNESHSKTTVNILGGKIDQNIYGGCNTSVVYGTTDVNIGTSVQNTDYQSGDILIGGTIFGGGEANAEGSESYDYSFISVTDSIDINIDGANYKSKKLVIKGSIFGSGNASSSSGDSNIYINSLGTKDAPNKAISIQRADMVSISNSVIELVGTTDRTNDYSTIKYTFNRIKLLKIKNDSILLLQQNANLLEELQSLKDENGEEIKATVDIDKTGKVNRNTNNRIYLLANKNLNVTTNQNATAYGKVSGMTFLGMYSAYNNGSYSYGIYDMENNDEADAGDIIIGGSYVLGLHLLNSDTHIDGFYSNYIDEGYTKVTSSYIEPTPNNTNYYMWSIGLDAINYSFTLTASKYSSLGTYELSLIDFFSGNTKFEVIGFNSDGLTDGVKLIDSNSVPKVAVTEEDNNILGLSMKSETTSWTSYNTTKFISENGGKYTGDSSYLTDNQDTAPSLTFYLYHAKNISLDTDLGTVVVTLQALTPINEIEYEVSLIMINIDLNAKTFTDQPAYDASITYGKKYEMPSATDVNITNNSSFTAYYSLYAEVNDSKNVYGNNNDYYHTLSSNYVLPVGTKITMLDMSNDQIKYYYYIVDENDYDKKVDEYSKYNEATYNLSNFIAMDSITQTNTYKDKESNKLYYHDNMVIEEFLFIFDFEDTNISGTRLNNNIILELRNNEDRTSISVLGIRQGIMKYNLYDASNVVLKSTIDYDDNYLYYDTNKDMNYDIKVGYDQTENRESIIDTNYESSSMGINISILDASKNIITSNLLVGTLIKIGNDNYYPSSDGVFRIKLSNKVSNLTKKIILIPGNNLPSGNYEVKIELFSSTDGLHITNKVDSTNILNFTLVGSDNSIEAKINDDLKIINGLTGMDKQNNSLITTNIKYSSVLDNPNIRIAAYLREKNNSTDNLYKEIDLANITSTKMTYPAIYSYKSGSEYEYIVSNNPKDTMQYGFRLKPNIESGTYKIVFRLYDNNQIIDEVEDYIIVKKELSI